MSAPSLLRLARHVVRLASAGQLRFRAETFGLYYPTPQYSSPWWRVSPCVLALLLSRTPSYANWLGELETIARRGGSAWWETHRSSGAPRDPSGDLPRLCLEPEPS